MDYLIDGHNLVAQMQDISLDDPNDEAKLVLQLRRWAAGGRKRRVTVVFDGGLPGGVSRGLSSGSVKVLFASAGQTADSVLIRRIRKVANPSEYTLISSDREVRQEALSRKMPALSAAEFARMLQEHQGERQVSQAHEEPKIEEEELAEWLDLFGEGEGG